MTIQRSLVSRRAAALATRAEAAKLAYERPHAADHVDNGGETGGRTAGPHLLPDPEPELPNYIGNYSKGLPHFGLDSGDRVGQVRPEAYAALLKALHTEDPEDFENIPLGIRDDGKPQGGVRRRLLTSPQSGLAFDLEGPDAQSITLPPAPRIDSAEGAGEMVELYWMALLRDVPFDEFTDGANLDRVRRAALQLRRFPQYCKIDEHTLFRSDSPGSRLGPYLSQFLLIGNSAGSASECAVQLSREATEGFITYGTQLIDQRQLVAEPGLDWMTDEESWIKVQDGHDTSGLDCFREKRRFLTTPRDLATYVHLDQLYQAYLNACLYMLNERKQLKGGTADGDGVGDTTDFEAKRVAHTGMAETKPTVVNAFPFAEGIPYGRSRTQLGFATFGGPHILSLVTEVATRALKGVWYQKWFVHRRLRPEAFGGWVHFMRTRHIDHGISADLIYSPVLVEILQHNANQNAAHGRPTADSYLLPQAFPEGSPTHPAYGAGHATVAAACTTILKAWFKDGPFPVPAVKVEPGSDGERLTWLDEHAARGLTVHGELNKVAANIAIGRNMAGVHYLSDYTASRKLGEEIAIGILQEQVITYNENPVFSFVTFDGRERITIKKDRQGSGVIERASVSPYCD